MHAAFAGEVEAWPAEVRVEMLAQAGLLAQIGPGLGRPRVDTLNGSRHANMKELRFSAGGGEWRVAFAFDPRRQAILLVGGDKSGVGQKRFYRSLIATADARFDDHLDALAAEKKP
ncbi:type II toxin-antitoxin system RelE/ParE family toxin [Zavarzinia compransoris]|uniref:type II toxin-antitoxin system RelE/ParE family toxin n=1 Tax=Zavarzinia compransoris TaxID=1264899 RepID=UPI001FB616AA|nr:type II toxin-antitoxin system RelE/ParE family toxin [Zavarzinia compransoris]